MVTVIIIMFALVVIGLLVWFCISNRKPDVNPDVPQPEPQPVEPVVPEPTPEPEPQPEPEPDNTEDKVIEYYLDCLLDMFKDVVKVNKGDITYSYLKELVKEAKAQYVGGKSCNGLPLLFKEDNFPQTYDYYGDDGSEEDTLNTLCGWLVAIQLSELIPYDRARLGKIGYEMAYDRYDDIYGYSFKNDPNIARMVAGAVYASMRGLLNPDIKAMRNELGGSGYNKTLSELSGTGRDHVAPEEFFTDFREFMPTAPGPYAPGYKRRPDNTYPDEPRDEWKNLKIDRDIHEMIVEMYNLDAPEHFQETVQAIADKEGDKKHLFGKNKKTEHFQFHPVFGEATIGKELPDEGALADLASLAFTASSSSRGILQSASVSPKQYGRLRPGCSWEAEGRKNSSTEDRRNVLVDFEIEDGDGSPTGYYDKNGNWVYMNGISSPEEFNEKSKNRLYANSYPSGHSAGIMGAAMVLMELMPERSDRILRAANQYAINRTIARYHWTSDTINGRVLSSMTNAVAHASSDYDDMLKAARKEI